MAKLTEAQDTALRFFRPNHTLTLMSRNRVAINNKILPVSPMTILYLVGLGMVEFSEPRRIQLSDGGRRYLEMFP